MDRPFTKPSCTKCGLSPDGHTKDSCPNLGKYCYGCRKFTDHIRKFCPDERAKDSNNKNTGKKGPTSFNRKNKLRKAPAGKVLRIQERRKKRNQKPIAFFAESNDDETDWVSIDPDELDDEEFSYAFAVSLRANTSGNSAGSSHKKDDDEDHAGSKTGSAFAATTGKVKHNITFILDCGCTEHIVNSRDNLVNFRKRVYPLKIRCANKDPSADLIINFEGELILRNPTNGNLLRLENVFLLTYQQIYFL